MTMTASACNQDMQQLSKPKIFVNGSFDLSAGTNVKIPVITLSSGYDMPIVGLGTYSLLNTLGHQTIRKRTSRSLILNLPRRK